MIQALDARRFDPDAFHIVTVSDGGAEPAWARSLGWPAAGHAAVPLAVRSRADRKLWAARLDQAVRAADRQVLLVAEGLGCAASAWWARLSPRHDIARVSGALMFAGERVDDSLFASPDVPLPFPTLLLGGAEARGWGGQTVSAPEAPRGDLPAWRQAQRLFRRWAGHVAEQDVARVVALRGGRWGAGD